MFRLIERAYAEFSVGVPISEGKTTYTKFSDYFIDLVTLAMNIGTAVAVVMVLYGAFKYVTSAGDDAKAKDGKDIIVGALVGLAILFLTRLMMPLLLNSN